MNLLIVTDHTHHAESNSLYALVRALHNFSEYGKIWIASRGDPFNRDFFLGYRQASIRVIQSTSDFVYDDREGFDTYDGSIVHPEEMDAILVRIPQPINPCFLLSLEQYVPSHRIINAPKGIIETASKAYLLNLPELIPDSFLCENAEQLLAASLTAEWVLKPLYAHGGKGICRISRDWFWEQNHRYPLPASISRMHQLSFPLLAMRFMRNVIAGDKRTIVANRRILGSAIRYPVEGGWMCNVAQGGYAAEAEADETERIMATFLADHLAKKGVILFGFDTLLNDDGHRILSEINTVSPGGIAPMEALLQKPVVLEAARAITEFLSQG